MTFNRIKALIVGVSLVGMLLVGVGSTTAQAQHRGIHRSGPVVVYRYRPYWGYRSFWGPRWGWGWNDPFWNSTVTVVDPIAQQRESGYSDGHKRGKDDAKHAKANAPESHKHFRDSHSQTYRQAFLKGYADGYREKMQDMRENYGR
jgi:hypothetical protein